MPTPSPSATLRAALYARISADQARRLARAGLRTGVLDIRAQQLLWSAGLTLLGAALIGLNIVCGRFNPMLALVDLVFCAWAATCCVTRIWGSRPPGAASGF